LKSKSVQYDTSGRGHLPSAPTTPAKK
jgi:hypothetical protein